MKKISLFLPAVLTFLCAGCFSPTHTTITEFDKEGKITKRTETQANIVQSLTESTRNKTVIAFESGWTAYLHLSTATMENPTPTGKIFAGKADKAVFSIMKDQQNWDGITKAILATREDIKITASGISSHGRETDITKP